MRGMILGAGDGTRIRPITFHLPKPMIPILRRPLMESIILQLRKFGINELVVNTSYLAPVLENYFRDGIQYGVDLCYSYEGQKVDGKLIGRALGRAGGMKKVQDYAYFFDDTFVVVCGDAWFDLDFNRAIEFHRRRGGLATIVTKRMATEQLSQYGVVLTDEHHRVLGFQEKPLPGSAISEMVNTGIYIFEPEIFNFIPADTHFDLGTDLFPKLIQIGIPFYAKNFDFQWLDVGNIHDIWNVTAEILTGKISGYPIPGKEERPNVFVGINCQLDLDQLDIEGPVVIGNGTRVETGAILRGPLVIGQNCHIQGGAFLHHSILDDYTFVSGAANLSERILHGEHCIDLKGNHFTLAEIGARWILQDVRERYVPDEITQEFIHASIGHKDVTATDHTGVHDGTES